MANIILRFPWMVASLLLTCLACGPQKNEQANEPQRGGVSGGGGYLDSYANQLLQAEAKDLADAIRRMPSPSFATMPQGWKAEIFATVIEHVRSEPRVERQRDGRDLMFDYGVDDKGPYIEALRPYFLAYGAQADFAATDMVRLTLRQRLMHEALHHLGFQEERAAKTAANILETLKNDHLHCEGETRGHKTCYTKTAAETSCMEQTHYELNVWPGAKMVSLKMSFSYRYQEGNHEIDAGGMVQGGERETPSSIVNHDDRYDLTLQDAKIVAKLTEGTLYRGNETIPARLTCTSGFSALPWR